MRTIEEHVEEHISVCEKHNSCPDRGSEKVARGKQTKFAPPLDRADKKFAP
jgi:hypothetical protein